MSDKERDELAATLNDSLANFYEPFDWHEATRIAARILAAGYRKPRDVRALMSGLASSPYDEIRSGPVTAVVYPADRTADNTSKGS